MRSKKVSSYFQEIGLDKPFIIMRKADEVVGEAPRFSDFCCGFHEIQASRVSRFWLERNASWDMLGQKVSTTSTILVPRAPVSFGHVVAETEGSGRSHYRMSEIF